MAKIRAESVLYRDGYLMFKTTSPEAMKLVINGKAGEYDISPAKQKRSKDANSYCWALIHRMAEAMDMTDVEVYRRYIKEVGNYKEFCLKPDEAKTFSVSWGMIGIGWQTEQVDWTQDGERMVIHAYYGSSTYSRKRMARLIDHIVQDCQSIGIETRPQEEIDSLLNQWKRRGK